jgi:SulP family sulfate permease
MRDVLAGLALAAMSVPQSLGYARIAGTPVVTGLYTLLFPLVAFAALGSSRYLVVAADSATAAILAGGLAAFAAPASPRWVALAGLVAAMTAGFLLLARLFRLGFLADFLSRTVLVGFLTGVGVQVGIAVLGEMLGIPAATRRTVLQVAEVVRGFPRWHLPTILLSGSVVAVVLLCRWRLARVPAPLLAVAGAAGASAVFDFPRLGIRVLGPLGAGLPPLALPAAGWGDALAVLPIAGACFLVVVAQSAATARAYAARRGEALDENADLSGLAAANAAAAVTGTFIVNGSPTQTAMVEEAGGRSQVAHLTAALVVAVVLLALTGPLGHLPTAVLGAVVFTIAVGLVDLKGLREIRRESPGEFRLAVATASVVVLVGIEQGILLAMALSLLRHARHSYHPHAAVLVRDEHGQWRPVPAVPGARTRPGLVVLRFGADLFYANADRFAETVRGLVGDGTPDVQTLVVDAGAITNVDYSAAVMLRSLREKLSARGVEVVLVHVPPSLAADLVRHRLSEALAPGRAFDTLHEALAARPGGGIRPPAADGAKS